jgi:hypothetical protein
MAPTLETMTRREPVQEQEHKIAKFYGTARHGSEAPVAWPAI